MRVAIAAALILSFAGAAPGAARADEDCRGPIQAEEAIRIARTAGVVRVQEVECDDGKWEVEGRDARGRKIEVEISARDGRILDIDRDD